MTRRDVEFDADGVTLRGWFYPGEGTHGPAATAGCAGPAARLYSGQLFQSSLMT